MSTDLENPWTRIMVNYSLNQRGVPGKHWKARSVGVKVVRELYGVMAAKGVKHGIVVTYGEFTSEATAFAKTNLIALIDGPKLTQMIDSVQQSGNMQAQIEVV